MSKPFDATHQNGGVLYKLGLNGYAMYWNGTHWRESASISNSELTLYKRV